MSADREWIVYYRENGMITYDRTTGLPRELEAPPWYAVTATPPIEYRLPINGRWELSTAEEIEIYRGHTGAGKNERG